MAEQHPEKFKFKGSVLSVSKAMSPEDINWNYIKLPKNRHKRRLRWSAGILFSCLTVVFVILCAVDELSGWI